MLESLAVQIDRDFEVIVVDGKSEDKTVNKAWGYKEKVPALNVLTLEERNVSKQRNLGAKNSKGKFLVFLDADAVIPKNFLSEIHYYLSEKDKQCKFLTTWIDPDSRDNLDKLLVNFANMGIEMARITNKPMVGGYNIIVEVGVFKKIGGFDEHWVPGVSEDHDLAKRLLQIGVELQIIKSPRLMVSLRRFRREGTLVTLHKYAQSLMNLFTDTRFSPDLFEYEMGGKVKIKKKRVLQVSEVSLQNLMRLFKN